MMLKKLRTNTHLMDNIIENLSTDICNIIKGEIIVGAELEFYFTGDVSWLNNLIVKDQILSLLLERELKEEKGENQYEICFKPINSPLSLVKNIILVKELLSKSKKIDFRAKPYVNEPGSALHIHLNLLKDDKNLFAKNGENESPLMIDIIAGLCHTMEESMVFFANNNNDYLRIIPEHDAPTTVSWGGNNRTVAIRIPCADENRRIEHRISSANTNPHLAMIAILIGIDYGIKHKPILLEKIYGRAYDDIYNLVKLPTNLRQSLKMFKDSKIVNSYLCKFK
jgi:glutamine synthetase